jgi:signal transduction histidine kinase
MALPFFVFVILGSTALVAWMQSNARRESRAEFATIARTNAAFITQSHLPKTERVAESLGRVLGMQMLFRSSDRTFTASADTSLKQHLSALVELVPENGIRALSRECEAIAAPLDDGATLILVRPAENVYAALLKPSTLAVLIIFWLLSLALAWVITSGVVRPLRQIAARLPHIEDDADASLPGLERHDEIGKLARAYLEARTQLVHERERREKAERLAILGRMRLAWLTKFTNPVAAIQLHAQMLESASMEELALLRTQSVPALLTELRRIESLVNQWMFLARPSPPQVSRTNLATLLRQATILHSAMAERAGVEITSDVSNEIWIDADSRRIGQTISNVIVNAIQAMPEGGALRIRGEIADTISLLFEDSGPGFSPEALAHHADLFYSEKEGGMGMGLSVTSEILLAHGGKLSVANALSGGAIVTFTLPKTIQ